MQPVELVVRVGKTVTRYPRAYLQSSEDGQTVYAAMECHSVEPVGWQPIATAPKDGKM